MQSLQVETIPEFRMAILLERILFLQTYSATILIITTHTNIIIPTIAPTITTTGTVSPDGIIIIIITVPLVHY